MTDEDAGYFAETMSEIQRKVILLCSKAGSLGYSRLAEKTGVSYGEAQQVGWFLQSANLADIKLIKPGYSGSAIFLNDRGEQVRQAALRLEMKQC
ncbi:hypothetical protein [Rhizorhapis sp. SPR117]|uniref:hypothetical protein n=1 Tax=Rhizorhapis sp. SPR117 TaxID=2912611 RepID=UPI001F45BA1E|nr:hypothetical protein [Rhizorhapis sp. SPR117]